MCRLLDGVWCAFEALSLVYYLPTEKGGGAEGFETLR